MHSVGFKLILFCNLENTIFVAEFEVLIRIDLEKHFEIKINIKNVT